jgi:hypothetical protein
MHAHRPRPHVGVTRRDPSAVAQTAVEWSFTWTTSIPVPGDDDRDGRADLAFFMDFSAGWYIYPIATGANYAVDFGFPGGTHVPAPGVYDGDGRTDPAFFYPLRSGGSSCRARPVPHGRSCWAPAG